ncbi:DUF1634 domain-containing protein [Bdellovibrio bacteriovorus]
MIREAHSIQLEKLELRISRFLRSGVYFAGLFLFVGWFWMWLGSEDIFAHLSDYHPQSFFEMIQWALIMNDRGILMTLAGLVILVCLPVIRVFLTGILFVKQKEYALALMAFGVFLTLIVSFFLGIEI